MFQASMPYRSLGKCGAKVSVFGLGGWTTYGGSVTDAAVIQSVIRAGYEAGINFFDIADIYAKGESERAMGKVLRDFPRHELVISSKLFWPMSEDVNDRGLSRKHVFESIDKTLQRIGTDYLDIYFCHRFDPETPVEETARAMDDLVHQGKVLYWGTSEWTGDQLIDVQELCETRNLYRPQVEQPQYSLVERRKFENDVRDVAVERGMGLVTWSPLASGLLTGKYDAGVPAGSRLANIAWLQDSVLTPDRVERVKQFKKNRRRARLQPVPVGPGLGRGPAWGLQRDHRGDPRRAAARKFGRLEILAVAGGPQGLGSPLPAMKEPL